jgi:hypothetical protein
MLNRTISYCKGRPGKHCLADALALDIDSLLGLCHSASALQADHEAAGKAFASLFG